MKYIHSITLIVKNIDEIRKENLNMSIPDGADLQDIGYCKINNTPIPEIPAYHKVVELPPTFNGSVWEEAWEVTPMSKEERNAYIYNLIDLKEREKIMPRITREATILQLETWALSKGYPLEQFRLANKGYRGLKELDETIQELRGQLR